MLALHSRLAHPKDIAEAVNGNDGNAWVGRVEHAAHGTNAASTNQLLHLCAELLEFIGGGMECGKVCVSVAHLILAACGGGVGDGPQSLLGNVENARIGLSTMQGNGREAR